MRSDASRRPFLVLYRFPRGFEGFVSPENGDPFIPALLLPAMKAHEPLEITAPVSPTLLRSVDAIQRIYRSWDPALSEVKIKAPVREKPLQRVQQRSRVGLFFSCGVDSYYSLLKNVQEHPADEETITDLIVVHGFDIDFGTEQRALSCAAHQLRESSTRFEEECTAGSYELARFWRAVCRLARSLLWTLLGEHRTGSGKPLRENPHSIGTQSSSVRGERPERNARGISSNA